VGVPGEVSSQFLVRRAWDGRSSAIIVGILSQSEENADELGSRVWIVVPAVVDNVSKSCLGDFVQRWTFSSGDRKQNHVTPLLVGPRFLPHEQFP
jgi:hypothetical protein